MNRIFLIGAAGLAVWFGFVEPGMAKPKKETWDCKCTCISYDAKGDRHEGRTMTFQTDNAKGCEIGWDIQCIVDDLRGRFAACSGPSHQAGGITKPPRTGAGGVADPGAKTPGSPKANPPVGGTVQSPAAK